MSGNAKIVSGRVSIHALGALALVACVDPFAFDLKPVTPEPAEEEEVCAASSDWLPMTPSLALFKPQPHPDSECPFYRAAWQTFLLATQPSTESSEPALRSYPTLDDLFDSAKPHSKSRAWLGDIKQAGGRQILIDQNGHAIYYGIHVNQAFADFVDMNKLRTAQAIRDADAKRFLPAGVAEFKSAWQEVDDADPSLATYITTRTGVSHIAQVDGQIVEDRDNPRQTTLRLLALHVVFSLPGHPELIWATFEHSDGAPDLTAADGKRNVAPIHPGATNPALTDPNNLNDTSVVSEDDYLLFKGGTTANAGNHAIPETGLQFDETSQAFPGQETSVYRMFPASKSNTIHPDDAITSLNFNMQTLFTRAEAAGQLGPQDRRSHYRLVGAVWMDKPEYFKGGAALQNDKSSPFVDEANFAQDIQENGSDSEFSILAGEDRLSSTAMESFTQAPDSFANCFSCHNTQAVTAKGIPLDRDSQGMQLLPPKLLNVSHVFSQFLLDESQ